MIMPKFYHYSRFQSDKHWIMQRMFVIPEDEKQEVANKYESLFIREGRKEANTWLHRIAKEYRDNDKL